MNHIRSGGKPLPEPDACIVIADSQFLVTESLKQILSRDSKSGMPVVVSGKDKLLSMLRQDKIGLLIIDPLLSDTGNIRGLREIKAAYPGLKILIISNLLTKRDLQELNAMAIHCAVLKTCTEDEIKEAVNAALLGKKYFSGGILDILLTSDEKKPSVEETGQLTTSEMDIMRLISDGLTTKEIAARKFISHHTVITHRKNIFRKLRVSSISELIMHALKAGWIDLIEYNI